MLGHRFEKDLELSACRTRNHSDHHQSQFLSRSFYSFMRSGGSAHWQVRHAHARRAPAAACLNGGFIAPTLGQTINPLQPLNISWDTSSLTNVQSTDIVLSAPGANNPLRKNVPFSSGSRVLKLLPRLWNDSASQVLQLNLYESGTSSFVSPIPAGPVITATYSAPSGLAPAAADMSLNTA